MSINKSLELNPIEAVAAIDRCIRANKVPFLRGSPGTSKSSLYRQIANKYNLKLIDVRLAQCDPTDLIGFPNVDPAANMASYVPMSTFPIEGRALPTKSDGSEYEGWLLLLDELPQADRAVQKASYKLILDRQVGEFNLHSKVVVVAAGNLDTDGEELQELTTAMQSRLTHLYLRVDPAQWRDWASTQDVDYRVLSFIAFKPDLLHRFTPDHAECSFPCPRTWEDVSDLIKDDEIIGSDLTPILAGTIGEGAAMEFKTFTRIYQDLLTIEQITNDPEHVRMPSEPSTLYALTGSIAHNANKKNIAKLMPFISRMGPEFQVVTMRQIVKRDPELNEVEAVLDWIRKASSDLF